MRQLFLGLACTLCVGTLTPAPAARWASLAWRPPTCCRLPQPAQDTLYPVPPTSRLRVVVAGVAYELEARIWRPVGPGPFPLAVIQHGTPADKSKLPTTKPGFTRAARWFVHQGFVVVIALRPGFGRSEGHYLEEAGPCANADYVVAGQKTALLEEAIIRACQTLPGVEPTHVVVIGQSAGGLGAVALGATPPPGVCGIISFAGGRGGNGKEHICGGEQRLVAAAWQFGQANRLPQLWLYAANDHFFNLALARRLAQAFSQASTPPLDFIELPPFGDDGHQTLSQAQPSVWSRPVEQFLLKIMPPR